MGSYVNHRDSAKQHVHMKSAMYMPQIKPSVRSQYSFTAIV